MSTHGQEPQYGQRRLCPEDVPAGDAPAIPPRAARRMARGLSFTLVLLGVLLGTGLAALGHAWAWVAAVCLVLPGLVGFAGVQAQLHPALRDASARPLRSRSKLWLIPWSLLLLGLLPLAGTFTVEPALAGTPRADLVGQYVSVLVVSGMALVVAAVIGFALVATVSLTVRDDDDSPLRPTGYAGRSPGGVLGSHYDSEWIRGVRRRPHGPDGGARSHPGGPPHARPPKA